MTVEPQDDLDRAIDEGLASIVAGEPKRVDAASVRKALADRRTSRIPSWLAVAAVLIVGIAVGIRERRSSGPNPGLPLADPGPQATRSAAEPQPDPTPDSIRLMDGAVRRRTHRVAASSALDDGSEGLARLTIPSIDKPEPLVTAAIVADAIQIARIEIIPLSVSSLPNENEQEQ